MDSNRLQMDRMLSAQQIRAARSLLGWSRRELAIVAGISQGTIKAIEQGKTDARLSTLRKLARTFTAHGVEFVMEGSRSGVTIKTTAKDHRTEPNRKVRRAKLTAITTAACGEHKKADTIQASRNIPSTARGLLWLRPIIRANLTKKR